MINEYIVRFKKGSDVFVLHISANNKEQAIKLAEMQSKFSRMGRGKFTFLSIRGKDEEDVYLKEIDKYSFKVKT